MMGAARAHAMTGSQAGVHEGLFLCLCAEPEEPGEREVLPGSNSLSAVDFTTPNLTMRTKHGLVPPPLKAMTA